MTDEDPQPEKVNVLSRLARGFRRGAIRLENSALFMYLRAFSRAGIILIALGFFLDLDDRQAATKFRAWQTVTNDVPGNVGKADAMAYLVKQGEPLNRIRVIGAYLVSADLEGASLDEADLSDTDLSNANLKNATLIDAVLENAVLIGANFDSAFLDSANLQGARLTDAAFVGVSLYNANLSNAALVVVDFTNADLSYTDLRHANLQGATVTGASLGGAIISGVDFALVRGLTTDQVLEACVIDGEGPVNLSASFQEANLTFKECLDDPLWQRAAGQSD